MLVKAVLYVPDESQLLILCAFLIPMVVRESIQIFSNVQLGDILLFLRKMGYAFWPQMENVAGIGKSFSWNLSRTELILLQLSADQAKRNVRPWSRISPCVVT